MARLVTNATITPGGAVGWFDPSIAVFNNAEIPTMANIALFYRVSGDVGQNAFYLDVDTAATPASIRSAAKDAIKADILSTYGVNIAKAAIKMSNSFE